MKPRGRSRWIFGALAAAFAAGCAGGVAAAPGLSLALAPQVGVTLGGCAWCAQGVCATAVRVGPVAAERLVVGWDRVAVLEGARLDLGGGGAIGAAGGGFDARYLPIREVRVADLQVEGAPLELPVLAGTVWPERHLVGDGVTIDDARVQATVPTPFGAWTVDVTRDAVGGVVVTAVSEAPRLPSGYLDSRVVSLPRAVVEGRWDDGRFEGSGQVADVRVGIDAKRLGGASLRDSEWEVRFALPATPIASAYAVFADAVPEADRARIGGTVAATGTWRHPGGLVEIHPEILDFTVSDLVGADLEYGPFTFRARDAAGEPILLRVGEGTETWIPLGEVGELLPAAIIAAEDARFRAHPGFDLDGIVSAFADNREAGDVVRGGSTLSQQLAKNLFLDGERTYGRKLRELLYAVNLEQRLGKRRILELYVNVVEWGPNLRGARRAAEVYFVKRPAGLLPEEAAFLAGILRNPKTAWRTQYLRDRPASGRVAHVIRNMSGLTPEQRGAALARPIRFVPP